jgi:hypothetical protein
MFAAFLLVPFALAVEFYLESPASEDRDAVVKLQEKVEGAGLDGRIVRRFRLGHGWEWVLLVESFASEEDARAAVSTLQPLVGMTLAVVKEDGGKVQPAVLTPPSPDPPAMTAAQWLARADAALGGATGGAHELARAGAVHFVFERSVKIGEKTSAIRHDYWREGPSRRLAVETRGAGQDSVATVTSTGAWIVVGTQTTSRDIGVAVGAVDGFAPEAVLTLALEAHRLLVSPEVQRFQVLEGAESGVRLGAGASGPDRGLTWIDLDAGSARPLRARYVTEGGPTEWDFVGWKQITPGIVVPTTLTVTRPDGSRETLKVERLEVTAHAPTGTFSPPGS